jgi:hypothetical protein
MDNNNAAALVGTWKQLSGVVEVVGSADGAQTNLSAAPNGYVNFAPDGRLLMLTVDSSRKKPAGNPPSTEDAAALFRSMIAYAGTYTVDGNKVTYHLDVSWNELWTGTDQLRFWRIEGDRLHVSTPEIVNPLTGKRSIHRLVFERVQPRSSR